MLLNMLLIYVALYISFLYYGNNLFMHIIIVSESLIFASKNLKSKGI